MVNGFSEESNLKPTDFLPYKIDDESEDKWKQGLNKPNEKTLKALSILIKEQRIPLPVVRALASSGILQLVTNH